MHENLYTPVANCLYYNNFPVEHTYYNPVLFVGNFDRSKSLVEETAVNALKLASLWHSPLDAGDTLL
ncbi:hypothetical protein M514_07680 [Trichuris suis]|uniref:Uncharacterized protein n=1 Tax=Trichuris suis TaxID=68888 RepID=A0A085MXI2_9BILA|nr:hypothetical protein M513_07680 [Trichuris suis]KFD61928.1 hypothetical protein M514_07680 [Trichuris suis]